MIATSAWLGVILSVVAAIALGMFWYSPSGFGNIWTRLNGWTMKKGY